jgi:hypothetical protein
MQHQACFQLLKDMVIVGSRAILGDNLLLGPFPILGPGKLKRKMGRTGEWYIGNV